VKSAYGITNTNWYLSSQQAVEEALSRNGAA
jgi:hypothetical protein